MIIYTPNNFERIDRAGMARHRSVPRHGGCTDSPTCRRSEGERSSIALSTTKHCNIANYSA
jgi:hypothetical protein